MAERGHGMNGNGVCPRCGKFLDDHNGWLLASGPYCVPPKPKEVR